MNKIDIACIIDDDQIYVYGMKKLIEISNFCNNLLVFKNGEEAIKYIGPIVSSEVFPDVILLDINMPVMDGWDFLEEFIKMKPLLKKKVIIYMVSSSVHDEDIFRANSYSDVAGYIVKPITIDDLKGIMDSI